MGNESSQETIYDCDECVDSDEKGSEESFLSEEIRREKENSHNTENVTGGTGNIGGRGGAGGIGNAMGAGGNTVKKPVMNTSKQARLIMLLPLILMIIFTMIFVISIVAGNRMQNFDNNNYGDYYYDDGDTGDDETTEYYFYKSSVELNQDGKGYSSTSYSYGDTISGINDFQDGTLTVSEPVDVSGDEGVTVPGGYKLYKIHYNFDKSEEDDICSYDETDYGYGTDIRGGGPVMYVHTKSGDYIGAAEHMEQYILFDDAETYSAKLTDGGLKSGIFNGEGNLFFLVEDGNFDHVAVCDMIGLFDSENQQENRIYLIGEPGQNVGCIIRGGEISAH